MGVQILNKDVSVISTILSKPKANISNVFGISGWAGGGPPQASIVTYLAGYPGQNWNLHTTPIYISDGGGDNIFWLYSTSTNSPTSYLWQFIAGTESSSGWDIQYNPTYSGVPNATPYPSAAPFTSNTVASGNTFTLGTSAGLVITYIALSYSPPFSFGPFTATIRLTVTNAAGSSVLDIPCTYGS